jgi:formiminotetrahydrofolate cyclodeaminase
MSAVLGCSLARMSTAYMLGDAKSASADSAVGELAARLAGAEKLLRKLVVEDMEAFLAYEAARREAEDSPENQERRRRAALAIVAVPTTIAATASASLRDCDRLKELVSKHLLSDLLAAAYLLHGAAHAAAANARLNIKGLHDQRVAETYRTQVAGALAHADRHLSCINSTITETLSLPC